MTHTPPSLFERAIDTRLRKIKRIVYAGVVFNLLIWAYVVYTYTSNRTLVVEFPTIQVEK